MTVTSNRCEARTGYIAGPFGEGRIRCHQWKGLRSYSDSTGERHFYCPRHEADVVRRFPRQASEACRFCGDTSAIVDGRYVLVAFGDGALGVVCDNCVSRADDEPDDPEDEFDRESMPEFNGAFR